MLCVLKLLRKIQTVSKNATFANSYLSAISEPSLSYLRNPSFSSPQITIRNLPNQHPLSIRFFVGCMEKVQKNNARNIFIF